MTQIQSIISNGFELYSLIQEKHSVLSRHLAIDPTVRDPLFSGHSILDPSPFNSEQEVNNYFLLDSLIPYKTSINDIKLIFEDWNNVEFWYQYRYRIVPVEIGADYLQSDWSSQFMPFKDFFGKFIFFSKDQPIGYLAQHDLFRQIPQLIRPAVRRLLLPFEGRQILKNIWFGPPGTFTPFHTDPYQNIYFQIIGKKTFFLVSPADSFMASNPSAELANTSSVNFSCNFYELI